MIEAVYENTKGQPGLVCGICEHMTEAVATDRAKPIRTEEVIDGKRIITDIITDDLRQAEQRRVSH